MKRILPNNHSKRVILPSLILAFLFLTTKQVSAEASVTTNVNVSTSTGGNTVNGQTVSSSSCKTKVTVNGKVYESNDCNQSYDYSDDSNGGKTEVHINSNKSTSVNTHQSTTSNTNVTPKPTVDIEPTIEQHKQEVKQKIAKVKAENEKRRQTLLAQIEEQLKAAFDRIANMFRVFAKD